jgi:hypothetical protein
MNVMPEGGATDVPRENERRIGDLRERTHRSCGDADTQARLAGRAEDQLGGSRLGVGRVTSARIWFGTFDKSFFTSDTARTPRPAVFPTLASVFGPKSARSTTATMIQWMGLTVPMGGG